MKRNILETVLGGVVLLVALVFLVFSYQSADVAPVSGYTVTAQFSEIGGLKTGADVRISGVKVGTVSNVSLDPLTYLAKVEISLGRELELPEDTAALIASESLLGGTYLALEPGAEEEMIPDGGQIVIAQSAQNLERLLGQFIFSLQGEDGSE